MEVEWLFPAIPNIEYDLVSDLQEPNVISIDLDPADQQRLDSLAQSQGQDGETLARRVLVDYLDFQSLPADSDADWADASVALAPEVMADDGWDEE